jgi:phosphoglycolate phosphatase
MIPTLLLDLDGTLVDSAPDLLSATNRLMAARGLPTFRLDEVIAMVGDGVEALVTRALAARGLPPDPAAVRAFSAEYGAHFADETRLYPGVAPALQAMRAEGWRLGVCTNKPEAIARTLLDSLGLLDLFAAVGGGDSFPVRKPDPAHMLATLRAAGGDVTEAVACGDHRNDVAAARGAGIPCIFAQWGYGTPAMADGATALAAQFQDVPGLAARLIAGDKKGQGSTLDPLGPLAPNPDSQK